MNPSQFPDGQIELDWFINELKENGGEKIWVIDFRHGSFLFKDHCMRVMSPECFTYIFERMEGSFQGIPVRNIHSDPFSTSVDRGSKFFLLCVMVPLLLAGLWFLMESLFNSVGL